MAKGERIKVLSGKSIVLLMLIIFVIFCIISIVVVVKTTKVITERKIDLIGLLSVGTCILLCAIFLMIPDVI